MPAADQGDRTQIAALAEQLTGKSVEPADVDQGYTGQNPAEAAQQHGIRLGSSRGTEHQSSGNTTRKKLSYVVPV